MFVNRYRLNPGYNCSFGRLKITMGVHHSEYVLYDSEGYREAPPKAVEVRSILSGMGLWLRQRSQLPAALYAPDGRPLIRSQLQKGNYILDRDCNRIYLAQANAPFFRVSGIKYVCWKPNPEGDADHQGNPIQKPITAISIKNKKELMAFAAWLKKVQDVNTVVNSMHNGLPNLAFIDAATAIKHSYNSGLSPAAAYAELPEANWSFPDADLFNVGTEVLDLPYVTWR